MFYPCSSSTGLSQCSQHWQDKMRTLVPHGKTLSLSVPQFLAGFKRGSSHLRAKALIWRKARRHGRVTLISGLATIGFQRHLCTLKTREIPSATPACYPAQRCRLWQLCAPLHPIAATHLQHLSAMATASGAHETPSAVAAAARAAASAAAPERDYKQLFASSAHAASYVEFRPSYEQHCPQAFDAILAYARAAPGTYQQHGERCMGYMGFSLPALSAETPGCYAQCF